MPNHHHDDHDHHHGGHGRGGHGQGGHDQGGHGQGGPGQGGGPGGPLQGGNAVETFLTCARKAIGGVYCTPPDEPNCTDCSGLVRRCYQQATGQDIGGDSHEQFKLGTQISRSEVRSGDLLFWDTMNGTEDRGGNTASHVGIATGDNRMINALTWGMETSESDLGSDYWTNQVKFLGARRLEF